MKLFLSDKISLAPVIILAVVIFAASTRAGNPTKAGSPTQVRKYMPPATQSTRLYTKPDPSARGGINGRIKEHKQSLSAVFAVPSDNPKLVYRGAIATTTNGYEFSFAGLPVAKYDLMLVCQTHFYEGFKLTQEADALTAKDRKMIEAIIMKSVPFFNVKKIHRCEGTTGRNNTAKCVLQEVRTLPVTDQEGILHPEYQVRSIKLAYLEDVGAAGWQLVNTREIIRMEAGADDAKGLLPHAYLPALSQVRVVDEVKELGEIELPVIPLKNN